MKRFGMSFMRWARDQLGPLLIMLGGVALTTDVFDGTIKAITDSAVSFKVWFTEPIPTTRWHVFAVAVAAALSVTAVIRKFRTVRAQVESLRSANSKLDVAVANATAKAAKALAESASLKDKASLANSPQVAPQENPKRDFIDSVEQQVLDRLGQAHRKSMRLTITDLAGLIKTDVLTVEHCLNQLRSRRLITRIDSAHGYRYGLSADGIALLVERRVND